MNSDSSPSSESLSPVQHLAEAIRLAQKLYPQDPEIAAAHATEAMRLAREMGDLDSYGQAVRVRAMRHGARGDLDAAMRDFCDGAEHADLTGNLLLKAQCLHGIATVHSHQGDFGRAIEIMHQSVTLRRKVGEPRGIIQALNNIGAFLAEVGSFAEAVTYFTESLNEARQSGNIVNAILTLGNLGHMKIECGEDEAAISFLEESVQIAEASGERIYKAMPLTLLSRVYLNQNRLDLATEYAQAAIEVAQSVGNRNMELEAWSQLGHAQHAQGHNALAETSQLRALRIAEDAGSSKFICGLHTATGRFYLQIGDHDKARLHLEWSLEIAEQSRQKQHERDNYAALAELCAAEGRFEDAYAMLRKSGELDEALGRERARTLLIAHMSRQELITARQEAEIHRLKTVELAEVNRENAALLSRLQRHAEQLAELVIRDPLTGLYNRRYLKDFIAQSLENPRHAGSAMTVAIADLDNFKQVNDRFSHQIGDEVLKMAARILSASARDMDVVVRYGGEEFVVVMPGIRKTGAARIAERMRKALADRDWTDIHPGLSMTVSIGLADTHELEHIPPLHNVPDPAQLPMEQLLARADRRLYMAKENGKNRTCWK